MRQDVLHISHDAFTLIFINGDNFLFKNIQNKHLTFKVLHIILFKLYTYKWVAMEKVDL